MQVIDGKGDDAYQVKCLAEFRRELTKVKHELNQEMAAKLAAQQLELTIKLLKLRSYITNIISIILAILTLLASSWEKFGKPVGSGGPSITVLCIMVSLSWFAYLCFQT